MRYKAIRFGIRSLAAVVLIAFAGASISACGQPRAEAPGPQTPPPDLKGDPFLDTLQARTFGYFWELTDNETGLTPDRAPNLTFSSIAAVGFALTAYGIGVERGYVTRDAASERTLNTLRHFWELPQGADTAAVAALALVQAVLGDWSEAQD